MNARQEIEQQLWTPDSLKVVWADFKTREPVDSLRNARLLVAACEERLAEIEARFTTT